MIWQDYNLHAAALCVWREARSEGHDGMRAVAHVIFNRAKTRNQSLSTVVYAPLQFSSMTAPKDPQRDRYPAPNDMQADECLEIVTMINNGGDFDLTEGATHYFADTIPDPSWASSMKFIKQLGHHRFYV